MNIQKFHFITSLSFRFLSSVLWFLSFPSLLLVYTVFSSTQGYIYHELLQEI